MPHALFQIFGFEILAIFGLGIKRHWPICQIFKRPAADKRIIPHAAFT